MARSLTRRQCLATSALSGLGLLVACSAPTPQPTASAPTKAPTQPAAAKPPASANQSPSPAPAKTAAPTAKPARASFKLALTSHQIDSAFQLMAKEKGFFDEQGIDIDQPALQSGDILLKGVIAGEYDAGSPGPSVVFAAVANGAPLKIIGTDFAKVTQFLFAKDDIKSLQDLYGRSVGVAAIGAYLYALVAGAMKQQGLDPDKVNWLNVGGSPEVFAALVGGKVDAGVSSLEFIRDLEKYPGIHAVLGFGEALPNYLRNGLFTTDKVLADRKDVVARAMTAYVKGIRYALDNKDEFVALSKKITGRDDDTISWTYDQYIKNQLVEPNFRVTREAIQFTQQVAVDTGQMQAVIPFEKVATDDIQKVVIANLGEWRYK